MFYLALNCRVINCSYITIIEKYEKQALNGIIASVYLIARIRNHLKAFSKFLYLSTADELILIQRKEHN